MNKRGLFPSGPATDAEADLMVEAGELALTRYIDEPAHSALLLARMILVATDLKWEHPRLKAALTLNAEEVCAHVSSSERDEINKLLNTMRGYSNAG